jgi:hypothetical protein
VEAPLSIRFIADSSLSIPWASPKGERGRKGLQPVIKGVPSPAWTRRASGPLVSMVLVTLALVLVSLVGCAAGRGGAAGSTSVEEVTTEVTTEETTVHSAQEETTVLGGGDHISRPPASTLSYGGQEVRGSLGSYCWTTFSGSASGSGECGDVGVIPVPRKERTLTVPSGSEMVFRYGGQRAPYTVKVAAAYLLNKKGYAVQSSHRSLKSYGSGVERTIPAELPSGEYVVDVGVEELQTSNQVVYYFRVMVG